MTEIHIISGFLGAGKTTLIKKLVKEAFAGEKLVLIENEFGEIGIDGGFLKEAGLEITEMNSGCICCSLVGDFAKSLNLVLEQYAPERILIEPSGVGKLSDVAAAVEGLDREDVRLGLRIAVADAKRCRMFAKNFGEFYQDQIASADLIVLSRTQELSADKLQACLDLLEELHPGAVVVTTPWDQLDGRTILNAAQRRSSWAESLLEEVRHEHHHHEHGEACSAHECAHDHDHEHHHHEHGEDCDCSCHDHDHDHEHHHHHADEVFSSWGRETARLYSAGELEAALAALENCGTVLRAKGILAGSEGEWHHFDYVPGEWQLRRGPAEVTGRLCVIGAELDEAKLSSLFGGI